MCIPPCTLLPPKCTVCVPLVAVHSTGQGTAGRPQQILVLREGAVPQQRAHRSHLVRHPYIRLSALFSFMLGFETRSFISIIAPLFILSILVRCLLLSPWTSCAVACCCDNYSQGIYLCCFLLLFFSWSMHCG